MAKHRLFPIVVTAGSLLATTAPFHLAGAVTAAAAPTGATAVVNGLGARLQPLLAGQQADANSNVVFSPASIGIALTMTSAGASGDTLAQMHDVLRIEGSEIHESMGGLSSALVGGSAGSFTQANSLWVQDGFAVEDEFVATLTDDYDSEPNREDFAGDPAGAVNDINGWVADATADHITDLLADSDITTLTRLVLANAVHLDAEWASSFEAANTTPEVFARGDGSTVETDFMHQTLYADYSEGDGFQAIVLPYTNGFEMVVALPDEGRLEQFEERFAEAGDLGAVIGSLTNREVELSLPRWNTETRPELVTPMQSLGMTLPFDLGRADFTNISTDQLLAISSVVHQANITVDEAGTEAAAATAVVMVASGAPVDSRPEPAVMDVNRPFLFAIRHRDTGAVVFQGHINDPAVAAGFG